jgi:hypothetical protein
MDCRASGHVCRASTHTPPPRDLDDVAWRFIRVAAFRAGIQVPEALHSLPSSARLPSTPATAPSRRAGAHPSTGKPRPRRTTQQERDGAIGCPWMASARYGYAPLSPVRPVLIRALAESHSACCHSVRMRIAGLEIRGASWGDLGCSAHRRGQTTVRVRPSCRILCILY